MKRRRAVAFALAAAFVAPVCASCATGSTSGDDTLILAHDGSVADTTSDRSAPESSALGETSASDTSSPGDVNAFDGPNGDAESDGAVQDSAGDSPPPDASDAGGDGSVTGCSDGGGIVPTSCAQADGMIGCCDPSGVLYYCSGSTLKQQTCASGKVCGWNSGSGYYGCLAPPAQQDPSCTYPMACGG